MTVESPKHEDISKKQEQLNDSRLYKEWKEGLKQIEDKDKIDKQKWKELTKKLENIQNKIEKKFWDEWKEFFISNMNDYLKNKYQAEFQLVDRNGRKDIVLVLEWMDNKKLLELVEKLIVNKEEVFIDENKDWKKEKEEKWIEIEKDKLVAGEVFVSKKEIDENKKVVGFKKWLHNKEWNLDDELKWWKVELINGHSYYEVWKHGDYLRAPIRLFTALSNEYFDGMSAKDLAKKIPQLWVKKWKHGYEFAKLPKKWFEKVGNFDSEKWKKIVKPGSKIDLTSLQTALDVKKSKVAKESKEVKESFAWWGRFYTWSKWEVWDIPDKWENITYDGYAKDYHNLNWKQISIWARNKYDTNEKNNKFSLRKEIDLGKGKKWFLVVWEWLDEKKIKEVEKLKDAKAISKALEWSKTEAWLTSYEKWKDGKTKITIKEVWDVKVHTVTETSWSVERWKDKEHPIYVAGDTYHFDWDIKGSIKFNIPKEKSKAEKLKDKKWTEKEKISISSFELNGKQIKLTDFAKDKNGEKKFEKIFWWKEGYLQLSNNHIVQLSFDKKEWIKLQDLWERKIPSFDVGWVKIQQKWEKLNFDKATWKIDFPNQIGWWKISWKLEKWKDWLNFNLKEKIAGHNIKIENIKDKKADGILQKIQTSLLYLWTWKKEQDKFPRWIKFDKKTGNINIDYEKITTKDPSILAEKVKVDKWKISETFMMDSIWKNVWEVYGKLDDKKTEQNDKKEEKKKTAEKSKDVKDKTDEKKSSSKQTEQLAKRSINQVSKEVWKTLNVAPWIPNTQVNKKWGETTEQKWSKEEKEGSESIDKEKVKKDIDKLVSDTHNRLKWLEVLANAENIPADYKKRLELLNDIDTRVTIIDSKDVNISIKGWEIKFPAYWNYKWESILLSWNSISINILKKVCNNYPDPGIDELL